MHPRSCFLTLKNKYNMIMPPLSDFLCYLPHVINNIFTFYVNIKLKWKNCYLLPSNLNWVILTDFKAKLNKTNVNNHKSNNTGVTLNLWQIGFCKQVSFELFP